MESHGKLPPIGARIMKSSAAIAICMMICYLRTLLPYGAYILHIEITFVIFSDTMTLRKEFYILLCLMKMSDEG